MPTKIMPISDLRRRTSEILKLIRDGGDTVYITQHGRPTAVLVDYEQYEALLQQLEDLTDMISIKQAGNEPERDYEAFLAEMTTSENDTES